MRVVLFAVLTLLSTQGLAQTSKPVAPAAAAKPEAAAPKGPHVVPFEALENHVGKSVVIKTNMRTTRSGVLKRFNRAGLLIVDKSRGFAMEIDIPRSTVKEVTVVF